MVENGANIDIAFCTPNDTQNDILKYGTRYAEQHEYIYIYIYIYIVNSIYRICRVSSYLIQSAAPLLSRQYLLSSYVSISWPEL